MNIKLKPKKKADGAAFYFSSLPERIQGNLAASMQSFDVISKGNIKIPKGTKVKEVKWNGEFFGKTKKKEPIVKSRKWKAPKKCKATQKMDEKGNGFKSCGQWHMD